MHKERIDHLVASINLLMEKTGWSRSKVLESYNTYIKEHHKNDQKLAISYDRLGRLLKNKSKASIKEHEVNALEQFIKKTREQDGNRFQIDATINNTPDYMYHALRKYFEINHDEEYMESLRGVYKVYVRSNFHQPKVYIGIARIEKKAIALTVELRFTTGDSSAVADESYGFKALNYVYEGYAFSVKGRIFLFTKHASNSTMHAIYLDDRYYIENGKYSVLKGAITGQLDDNIYANRILFERQDPQNDESAETIVERIMGLHSPEHIHPGVISYLDRTVDNF